MKTTCTRCPNEFWMESIQKILKSLEIVILNFFRQIERFLAGLFTFLTRQNAREKMAGNSKSNVADIFQAFLARNAACQFSPEHYRVSNNSIGRSHCRVA